MDAVRNIEKRLAQRCKRRFCVLTGSGTSAIYLALKARGFKKEDAVLIPAICCFSPVYAAKYAGMNVDFCDVSLRDGCMSIESLRQALKKNRRIRAVIGVHLFGNVMDVDTIARFCKKQNVFFIEDACQAYGSRYKGSWCGSFADAAVLSFGHTKILDSGGNGALLTDDELIADRVRRLSGRLGRFDDRACALLWEKHRAAYYSIRKEAARDANKMRRLGSLWRGYRRLFLHGIDRAALARLNRLLRREPGLLKHRIRLGRLCQKLLQGTRGVSFLRSRPASVPWRFSFFLSRPSAEYVLRQVRKKGLDISSWYPNLAMMGFEPEIRRLRNAEEFEKKVINIWVDQTKDRHYAAAVCSTIQKLLR